MLLPNVNLDITGLSKSAPNVIVYYLFLYYLSKIVYKIRVILLILRKNKKYMKNATYIAYEVLFTTNTASSKHYTIDPKYILLEVF